MFSTIVLFALAFPLVRALTLNPPTAPASGSNTTITWQAAPTDPPFSLFLSHPDFNTDYAIANNVEPSQGSISLVLPPVNPGPGYSLKATAITNVNQVYSTTPAFSIMPGPSTTGTALLTTTTGMGATTTPTGTAAHNTGTAATATTAAPTNTGKNAATSVKAGSYAVAALGAIFGVAGLTL